MFDKIYNCDCNSSCHQVCTNGKDTYHDWNTKYSTGCSQCSCGFRTAHQQIIEQNIYYKGYADGRRDAYEDKVRFRTIEEHEKYAAKLKEAMKPLEDLLKEIKI